MLINTSNLDLDIEQIKDMQTILNHSRSAKEHTPRFIEYLHDTIDHNEAMDQSMPPLDYPEYSYRLRHVPSSLTHNDLQYNLSYYA